jgi:hypothetical protein
MHTLRASDPLWDPMFLFSTPLLVLFSKDDPDRPILTKGAVIPFVSMLLSGNSHDDGYRPGHPLRYPIL